MAHSMHDAEYSGWYVDGDGETIAGIKGTCRVEHQGRFSSFKANMGAVQGIVEWTGGCGTGKLCVRHAGREIETKLEVRQVGLGTYTLSQFDPRGARVGELSVSEEA